MALQLGSGSKQSINGLINTREPPELLKFDLHI